MLNFKDGKFKILQLSDMQDTYVTNVDTPRLVKALIEKVKPDLIVLTGDQIKGYGIYFNFGSERKNADTTLTNLLKPIAESNIPFTAVFGNHDEFGSATKDFQWSIYNRYENFIGENFDVDFVEIKDGDDTKFVVYLFDTVLDSEGHYVNLSSETIKKFKDIQEALFKKCKKYVPAIAFQHIPPEEIYSCLKASDKPQKGYFQGAGKYSDKYYTMPDYAKNDRSFMGENAAVLCNTKEQLDALCKHNDVKGLYFGHDHNNSFVVKYNNLDLGYTQGCGFNVYGPGKNRGGRVFEINSEDGTYETYTVTEGDLDNFKEKRIIKNFLYTHSPSSVGEAKKWAKKAAKIGGAALLGTLAIYKIIKVASK